MINDKSGAPGPSQRELALSRWDNEGGAGPGGHEQASIPI
jgi:hypothetical protein